MLESIPQRIELKDKFVERYKIIFGADYDEFIKYSSSYIRKSVRVNTLKISVSELKKRLSANWDLEQVPWCKEGFWIKYRDEKRFDIGNTPEHQLGYIYVQDAASMIPAVVLAPKPGEVVLDMCAAPGSKTTQLAQYMKNKGVLVANDIKGDRLKALGINIQRCGVSNTVVTQQQGNYYRNLEFDRVLVDAPCSGTGTIRRSLKVLKMWGPHLVRKMSGIQRQLIEAGFLALKPGGNMVYSTCTQEPEENEAVVSHLLRRHQSAKLEDIKLNIKRREPILEFENLNINPKVKKCLRIAPQDNDTEGFFVAKITKNSKIKT
ncbi:MAG: RsmB/NOP family class I SAM-dependent RNA methyltransferase [Nanoarchaeota archaeon]|nr:RsmB/NOP family class I SAM-dependent RNA methyltransferase [Nanoarchaeota archaeon]MBU1269783.1 RsmB/NOP family class I SAM-dependent RNA methyltransferase [Nanoarchaeota archaeon]MBU1604375.1 RsmB/NOP family class I SAM-dependent RNA methyltransferase [Nanoarchaeota archaeon]MBU2443640.1 RsmB/NOP family class I SAM-dependent RNA methyltransferase [Nanoarchaeota archaeon]